MTPNVTKEGAASPIQVLQGDQVRFSFIVFINPPGAGPSYHGKSSALPGNGFSSGDDYLSQVCII